MHTHPSLFLTAALAVSVVIPCGFASAQNMFRGDVAHDAVIFDKAPASFEKPLWVFKTNAPVISSASIAGDTAYFGSDDRNLYAVDVKTGAKRWRFATGGKIRSTPAVSGGLVYFISYDSKVYALDAVTGEKKWIYATAGERFFEAKNIHGCVPEAQTMPDFWDTYESSPAVADGVVYVGSGDGNLYALDAASGNCLWKFATGDVVHSSPAVADGMVYFGSWDTFFYALDAKTGAEKWRFKTGDDPQTSNHRGIQSSPVVKDGVVFFGCRDAFLYALDAKTGAKKWAYDNKGDWVNCAPAVNDGLVWIVTSIPADFIAIDEATGVEKYKGNAPFILFSSPLIAGDRVYAGSFDGCLYSYALKGGEVRLEFSTSAAAAHRGEIYKEDGSINWGEFIFRNNDFDEIYFTARRLYDAGAMMSSPVMTDDMMLIGSSDGCMYCFR